MVKIKVTERIAQFIDDAVNSKSFDSDVDVLRASKEEGGIEIAILDRVCKKWREKNPTKKIWLHELTKGSEAYFPPKVAPARNPELEKRLQEIKHEVDNRKYYKYVSDISYVQKMESYRDTTELRTFKSQASIGVNIIFTVISFFAAGFFAVKYYTGNTFFAVIIGLFCGVGGLVLDSFLFILRGSRADSASEKREKQERKTFSPFADPTDQLDARSRLRGVDIDELLRKAKESKDGVVVMNDYEEQAQEEKIEKKGANNNKKDTKEKKAQASPQAKNKKEKNSGKVKTA